MSLYHQLTPLICYSFIKINHSINKLWVQVISSSQVCIYFGYLGSWALSYKFKIHLISFYVKKKSLLTTRNGSSLMLVTVSWAAEAGGLPHFEATLDYRIKFCLKNQKQNRKVFHKSCHSVEFPSMNLTFFSI